MHSSGDIDVTCFVSGCELVWFLMCTLLVTQMWPALFQDVSWLGSNAHSSGDTDVASLVSGCELAWLLMCTLLVTQMWLDLFQDVSWPCF